MKKYEYVIIGAGTAGLSARKEIEKVTNDYVVIDNGILGTTCARVGCMPSKVLIQAANDYHRRNSFKELGIQGSENLIIDHAKVMTHVRKLRDRFVRGVTSSIDKWKDDHLIQKRATFIDQNTLDLGDEKIQFKKIIIATGSSPVIPEPWKEYQDFLIDTDSFFELEELPKKIAVIGLGVIGIELGQALHRLGVDVVGIGRSNTISGVSDPKIKEYVAEKFSEEMNLDFTGVKSLSKKDNQLIIKTSTQEYIVDKALVSVGRSPNITKLGLENFVKKIDEKGIPLFNEMNFQLLDHPHIAIAGDVNAVAPILHEAADQGAVAGHLIANEKAEYDFCRRTPIGITFCSPNIAYVGKKYQQLKDEGIDFEAGEVSYEGQGRAIVMLSEKGMLRVYGEKGTNKLLGAELFAPSGEHLAHLLSWAISSDKTVQQILSYPFYHPVIEEGLRTALRSLSKKLNGNRNSLELARCSEHPTNNCNS